MKNHYLTNATQKILGVFILLSLSNSSLAHHSFAASFDSNTSIEVAGVVTEFSFKNPHVIINLDVTDEDGVVTNWMAEGPAASGWRRGGWDTDSLKAGDMMSISGNATHDGSPMVSIQQMALLNPSDKSVITEISGGQSPAVALAAAQAQAQVSDAGGARPEGGARGEGGEGGERPEAGAGVNGENVIIPLTLPTGEPNFTGMSIEYRADAGGQGRGRGGPDANDMAMPYNDLGKVAEAAFDLANDPQVFCDPIGVVRQSAYSPYGFELTQYPDHVTIEYEEYGSLRAVFFGTELPKPGVRSHMGDSVARYEGDALIIETVNILANPSGHRGRPLSENARLTEVYTREDDPEVGSIVTVTSTVVDPQLLAAPWTIERSKAYVTGYDYIENGCEPPLRDRPDNVFQYSEFDMQFLN